MDNLLFVMADQMRGMDMGCAGSPDVQTPTMDRLAAEGVRLTHCFATTPVCCPNRAVLWSGTYSTTNLVPSNDLPLPLDLPTLGTLLRDQGYRMGYVGKWHLDGVPRERFTPPGPRRHGFDDFWAAYNCTHDYFHTRYFRDTPELIEVEGYEPQVQTDLALEFLEGHDAQRPFCLVLSWGPPHDPYHLVPQEYRDRYDPQTIRLRPNVQPEADNPLAKHLECRRATADYFAQITALDDQLARLLAALERLDLSENTLVIFTSDHGDMLWSHGFMKKQSPYDEAVRVPFIARRPGRIAPGSVSDVLFGSVDLLPTLLSSLGAPPRASIEGLDLSPHLLGRPAEAPESLLLASYLSHDEAAQQAMPAWRAVRTPRYTYAEQPGRLPWLLFDNEQDPCQMENRIGSAAHQAVEAELREMLSGWLTRTQAPFLPGLEMIDYLGLTEAWQAREKHFKGV